jgi:seryl-tRNA synthetase
LITVIDVRALRNDPAAVRAALARRNKPEVLTALDQAIALDEKMRNLTNERDQIRQEINEVSKSVGQLRRDGANAEAG